VSKELQLWAFVAERVRRGERVMLLVVAQSGGSSPGRAGYKMAVAQGGELCGSIGGGVMEVSLAEDAKKFLLRARSSSAATEVREQVHRKNVPNSSGMICSGKQTVIRKKLTSEDADTVNLIVEALQNHRPLVFEISNLKFQIVENTTNNSRRFFSKTGETDFVYREQLGPASELYIIGGGHCALALSKLMSTMDFRITILDDRPSLNTLEKNDSADEISIINGYDEIASHIPNGDDVYVVVMTVGYASDAVVIRQMIDLEVKYLGVLGSKAKMATLLKELKDKGYPPDKLARIRTPIGLAINSRTPEEIAVSIAAEIISIKNQP
jgi:xanthine dehydrogenase accessory factor